MLGVFWVHNAEAYFYPMNEPNRRIASLNRIDEMNQRIAFQNDPLIASWAAKTVPEERKSSQEQPKTSSRQPKNPPRPSKEGPRAPKSGPRPPQDGPRTPAGALLGRSWSHVGTNQSQDRNPDRPPSISVNFWGRFWLPTWVPKRPQDDPKTSQKSRRKMHDFFIALGPVLDRS